ncbi:MULTISPECIES: PH domain-containing protein [unclassified Actinopolyspora]|uniref:PH domain-containing protein n=1 Tax=unclassified Actinopolyspora TaxID=2639451 RepID=UPI0013F63D35|nr:MULTISPECIES: PH domain-containing protein [unclassified Actinopolyspora]NHD18082.1 PH domain-containing protein [Actinopolyspora sp. BKK2]NHE78595.1 PH domain-containing protein [Actinopolyspora sp. BKK1]
MNDPHAEPAAEQGEQRSEESFAEWQRLDLRSVFASMGLLVVPMLPVVALVLFPSDDSNTLPKAGVALAMGVFVIGAAWWRWFFTRFRVTPERFELRQGNFSRSFHSIPRERIRSVDLTAPLPHRLLGISVIRIGTGRQSTKASELRLDALPTDRAERLREQLLRRRRSAPADESSPAQVGGATSRGAELARMRPSWYLYSTLTASLLLVTWAGLGSVLNTLGDLLRALGVTSWLVERLPGSADSVLTGPSLWIGVLLVLLVLLVGGWVGALMISLEMWWGYRLSTESGEALHVRRGLLTTRAVSLEKRRLRGIELAEPLLLRLAGGSRLTAVATGLGSESSGRADNKALLPPAPRHVAERIGAEVLERADGTGRSGNLRGHPRAALRRRMTRAVLVVLVLVGATVVARLLGPLPWWSPLGAVLTALPAALFAWDAYRNLGHELRGDFLVTRHGTAVRRTVQLQRNAIIGWRVRQSPFQRLAGLVTMSATTAAGDGQYSVHDVEPSAGVALADEAVPGLLTPFLRADPAGPTGEGSTGEGSTVDGATDDGATGEGTGREPPAAGGTPAER